MARQKGPSPPVLQSVDHALATLEVLGAHGELGVNDLARCLGLPPPNAYRLLSTLAARGYAEQDPRSRKYRLGIKLLELGHRFSQRLHIREVARPVLKQLAADTQESAFLAVLTGSEVIVIEMEESSAPIYASLQVGMRYHAPNSSAGKVLLAFGESGQAEAIAARGLPPNTPATVTDPETWLQELHEVRRRGYATNYAEVAVETGGVAVPVYNHEGRVIAAAGICALASRMRTRHLDTLVLPVVRAGHGISRALGHHPVAPALDQPRASAPPRGRGIGEA